MSRWSELRVFVGTQQEQLRELLTQYEDLVRACAERAPDHVQLAALGAVLHSFYSGMEKILTAIAEKVDCAGLDEKHWHRELVDQMTRPGHRRPAVLATATGQRLQEYRTFRHFFRNGYPHELRWDRMHGLVADCRITLTAFNRDIDAFMTELDHSASSA